MKLALRALVWLAFSAGLLLAGFTALAGGLLLHAVLVRGEAPDELRREALGAVFSALVTQALWPALGCVFASWLVIARLAPQLERSSRGLALGLFACAVLWFPVISHYSFTMWTPRHAGDYVITLLLVAAGAALALWLPRFVSSDLGPGCFTATPKRGIVHKQ